MTDDKVATCLRVASDYLAGDEVELAREIAAMAVAHLSPDRAAKVERIFSVSHYSMGRHSGAWVLDGLANILQPPAAPTPQAKPRRPRKPTLARLVAKAKQLGVDVTIDPNGAATFRMRRFAPDAGVAAAGSRV
jgi:hypothetical protein